jgi:chromosome segregation ATPase
VCNVYSLQTELSRERDRVLEWSGNEALHLAKLDSQAELHLTEMKHLDAQILTLRGDLQEASSARKQMEENSTIKERELGEAQTTLDGVRVAKEAADKQVMALGLTVSELESRLASTRAMLESESHQRQSLEQRIES